MRAFSSASPKSMCASSSNRATFCTASGGPWAAAFLLYMRVLQSGQTSITIGAREMHIEKTAGGAHSTVIEFSMRKPYDMHHHPREGEILKLVAPMLAKRFAGAIIMPNTDEPILTAARAESYRQDILAHTGVPFHPLMTLYLSNRLEPEQLAIAIDSGNVFGVKYYPFGLTTNSEYGIKVAADLWTPGTRAYELLQMLADLDSTLLLHAADGFDADGNEQDPYDQEPHFFRESLPRIRDAHRNLRISVEHLSTSNGVAYMMEHGGPLLGCSLTAQHLLLDRRDVHRKGFNPHRFWWPIIQRAEHKHALLEFAAAGYPFVWLGSDSAPHPLTKKEASCCGGGVLTVHAGIELYAEAFDSIGALDKLEAFASLNGPDFYDVSPSEETIRLVREDWTVVEDYQIDVPKDADPRSGIIRPFRLGESVKWKLVG